MHILEEKIRAARAAGRHALIPFVTFGFPDEKRFWPALVELDENGADIIEIGVPFSDPVADGPVVEEASRRVLSDGVCLERIMEELKLRAGVFRAGIVLMGYLNPFLQYGLEKLAVEAREAGVHGFIIPDLPFEEKGEVAPLAAACGVDVISMIAPTSSQRIERIAGEAAGFLYVVSSMGVTGVRKEITTDLEGMLGAVRKATDLPAAVGFGISTPEQAAKIAAAADGVIVGSAIVKIIEKHGEAAGPEIYEYVRSMKAAVKQAR